MGLHIVYWSHLLYWPNSTFGYSTLICHKNRSNCDKSVKFDPVVDIYIYFHIRGHTQSDHFQGNHLGIQNSQHSETDFGISHNKSMIEVSISMFQFPRNSFKVITTLYYDGKLVHVQCLMSDSAIFSSYFISMFAFQLYFSCVTYCIDMNKYDDTYPVYNMLNYLYELKEHCTIRLNRL